MPALSVPIIDLQPWFSGTAEGRQQVAKAVQEACRDIGFLVITQHHIPADLIERVSDVSRQFFALPLAEKRLVDRPRPDAVRGYSAVGEEGLSYTLEEAAPGGSQRVVFHWPLGRARRRVPPGPCRRHAF